jgi:hypothetical protein
MLRLVALARTDVLEECVAIMSVTRIGKLGTTSVLTTATQRHIQEDGILQEKILSPSSAINIH